MQGQAFLRHASDFATTLLAAAGTAAKPSDTPPTSWEEFLSIAGPIGAFVSGALTLLIAFIAVYIAWRQHRTAQYRLNLDLYERRFKVYRGLADLLNKVVRDAKVNKDDLRDYHVATDEKEFLFKADILEYMKQVFEKVVDLRSMQNRMAGLSDHAQDEHRTLSKEETELLRWLMTQSKNLPEKYARYLKFSDNL